MVDVFREKIEELRDHSKVMPGDRIFFPLKRVSTYTATPKEESQGYIKENMKRNLPKFQQLDGYMKIKDQTPFVIIGGGPSLKDPAIMAELKEMASKYPTIAAGSAYDFCIKNGIVPTYAAILDPDNITLKYIKNANHGTIWLVASQCHPEIFERLRGYRVCTWHCYTQSDDATISEVDPDYMGIGGGSTVGMRCLNMGILLGYTNLHFFGFDSCLAEDGNNYAYDLQDPTELLGLMGKEKCLYPLMLGLDKPDGHVYKCYGYHLSQIWFFHDFYKMFNLLFTPTFHGDTPLAKIVDIVMKELERSNGFVPAKLLQQREEEMMAKNARSG